MNESIEPKLSSQRSSELRAVVAMSIPIVVTTASRALMSFVDFYMVTKLGEESMAAIVPAGMTVFIYIALGMGCVMAVSTFASQSLGRKNFRECSAYAWQGIWLALVFALGGLALAPALRPVFALYGHAPGVAQQELIYARIILLSVGPTVGAVALASFFNGIHKPWVTMFSALEANLINIVLNYCLIFGKFGFPEMGIAGAAWGTVAATAYRVTRLAVTMCLPRYHEKFACRHTWRWSRRRIVGLLRVGAPQGLQWLSDVMVWSLFVGWLIGTTFGTTALAASNIAWQFMGLAFMPALGVGHAVSAMVGRAIGQGNPALARRFVNIGVAITTLYMFTVAVIYFVGRDWLVAQFLSPDVPNRAEVIAAAGALLVCAAVFQVFDGAGMTYVSALRGAGDTAWPAGMFIISHWVMVIGGGWTIIYLFPQWGPLGPWIAAAGLIIVTALLLGWRWMYGPWEKIQLFKHEDPEASHALEQPEEPDVEHIAGETPVAT